MKPNVLIPDLPEIYISSDEAGRSLPKIPQNIIKNDSNKVGHLIKPEFFDCLCRSYHAIEQIPEKQTYEYKQSVNKAMSNVPDTRKCFITCDPSYSQLLESLPKIATSDAGVFITGESGTGKELIANEIHHLGPRANRPFMTIDCSTREPDMLEAELFGHIKGAHTGATTTKTGLIAMSEGGTLFLDELNSMGSDLQRRLIRFLETHTYYPLGSEKLCVANVRIIAAANIDVRQAIAEGKFSEHLYHRLSVYELHLPPLRNRPDDIPLLAEHFADELRIRYQKPNALLSPEIIAYLMDDPLTGNIRELQNMIERGFAVCGSESIKLTDIMGMSPPELNLTHDEYMKLVMGKARRHYLRLVLFHCNGIVPAAAEKAGMERSYFFRMLNENNIDPRDFRREKNQS